MIKPINACILVELKGEYSHIATTEKKYDTVTAGVCINVPDNEADMQHLIGKTVYFDEYKDGTRVGADKKLALIKFEDIRGYDETE